MSAVLRLLHCYFFGARGLRWVSIVAWTLILPVAGAVLFAPRPDYPVSGQVHWIVTALFVWGAVVSFLGLFFGAALMPTLVARLAASRSMYVLPHGRIRLLASVLLTVTLVALAWTLLLAAPYLWMPLSFWTVLSRALIGAFLIVSLLFVLVGFVGRARTATGMLASSLLVLASLSIPLRFIGTPERLNLATLLLGLALWSMAAAAFLFAPRLKPMAQSLRQACERVADRFKPRTSAGREADLLLGTHRPWLFALGQLLPLAVAPFFIYSPTTWLYFLAMLSAIGGAITSFAAARSRALWLRTGWSRAELLRRVEAAHWRQHSHALVVQIVLLVGIGSFREFPTDLLALGMPLLVLTTAATSYLGLLITRGIGPREALAGIASMLCGMATAVAVGAGAEYRPLAIGLLCLLALLALCYRAVARRRWDHLDWALCRRDTLGATNRVVG